MQQKQSPDEKYWDHCRNEERLKLSALVGMTTTRQLEARLPATADDRIAVDVFRTARACALERLELHQPVTLDELVSAAGLS